jgi:hypothetical protein
MNEDLSLEGAERLARAVTQIKVRQESSDPLPYRCDCACYCGIRHRVAGPCTLCRRGDHWKSLTSYMLKISLRSPR